MNSKSLTIGGEAACAKATTTSSGFAPSSATMRAEVVAGLSGRRKSLPCKYLYDDRGSKLFDDICELPEYYLTRTELQIMRDHVGDIAEVVGRGVVLVEYGSGSSLKTRVLLDHLKDVTGYVPIDISGESLLNASKALAAHYPRIRIEPVFADYTQPFRLPRIPGAATAAQRVVAYFPGSTIGNFERVEAVAFLRGIRATCGSACGLLIGVDLKKEADDLNRAYNDSAGLTAEFNRNVLRHANRVIGSRLEPDAFDHYAFYSAAPGRVEMHLVSHRAHTADLGHGVYVHFDEGESIHTESCHKFTLDGFRALAEASGFRRASVWTDPRQWFSVQYFLATEG
jgi:dimethylhistidine N-methyltransferase